MHSQRYILDAIGNTPLVELRGLAPDGSARIVAKLESANPTGSMKDRLARMIVQRAAASGRLPPGGTVARWWNIPPEPPGFRWRWLPAPWATKSHFAFSDAFSDEKRFAMLAYGADNIGLGWVSILDSEAILPLFDAEKLGIYRLSLSGIRRVRRRPPAFAPHRLAI